LETIKDIFKIGNGPSSSHTMGPRRAAEQFKNNNPTAARFRVTLYGSLAATGVGHLTDKAIFNILDVEKTTLAWEPKVFLPIHPNGIKFEAFDARGSLLNEWTTYSIGGGTISDSGERKEGLSIYPLTKMADILQWCQQNGRTFWEFVNEYEEPDLWDYLEEVWKVMTAALLRGIEEEGVLPGGLHLPRKASAFFTRAKSFQGILQRRALVFSYALAVADENAAGGLIVTAPTCGSCGVLPAVLYNCSTNYEFSDKKILRALATAGLIGTIIKYNASISGAEVGCQGEIGSATSMASAAAAQLFGGTVAQVEYAAAIGMEHFLGLTCDPVCGLVQVPCIERNAFGAARAMDANMYAILTDGHHLVSFDTVVEAMKRTGHDIPSIYKETAEGGLAILMNN
jgi:L-serine dehydratase